MRAACSTLAVSVSSAPGCSGRGRNQTIARAMRVASSPPAASAAVAVAVAGRLDLLGALPSPSPALPSSSSRFRPARRRRLRPLSHQLRAKGPEDKDKDDEDAPSTSSSSSSSSSKGEKPVFDIEKNEKTSSSSSPPRKATPLGDLIALISPARKREAGGPPPPTFSKRMRAIKGSLRAVAAQAWRKTLTLPGFSHVAAALRALDVLTRPGRDLVKDSLMDINERFEMFRVEEAKQRWAWESRSKAQGLAWKNFCDHCLWFLFAIPYLILCPAHFFFSCFLPLFVGVVAFDNPVLNGVNVAWVAAMVAGKLRRGLLSGLVGLPPGFSGI